MKSSDSRRLHLLFHNLQILLKLNRLYNSIKVSFDINENRNQKQRYYNNWGNTATYNF